MKTTSLFLLSFITAASFSCANQNESDAEKELDASPGVPMPDSVTRQRAESTDSVARTTPFHEDKKK